MCVCIGEWEGGRHPVAGQIKDHGGFVLVLSVSPTTTGVLRSVESRAASVAEHLLSGVVNLRTLEVTGGRGSSFQVARRKWEERK